VIKRAAWYGVGWITGGENEKETGNARMLDSVHTNGTFPSLSRIVVRT
jgi:hypothetical protein